MGVRNHDAGDRSVHPNILCPGGAQLVHSLLTSRASGYVLSPSPPRNDKHYKMKSGGPEDTWARGSAKWGWATRLQAGLRNNPPAARLRRGKRPQRCPACLRRAPIGIFLSTTLETQRPQPQIQCHAQLAQL